MTPKGGDNSFLILAATFMLCIAAPWSCFLIYKTIKCKFRDETTKKVSKTFLVYAVLNISLWVAALMLSNYLKTEEWAKNFDPF